MDQEQVNIFRVQPLKGLFHGVLLLIESRPQLSLQKDFLTGQPRLLYSAAHRFFIHIGIGRVNQAVSTLQGVYAGVFCLVRGKQKGTSPRHGHLYSVV